MENKLIDFKVEWPLMYNKIKDTVWFKAIAIYYSEKMTTDDKVKLNYKSSPVIVVTGMEKEQDEETKTILQKAKSPENVEWWIVPHDCLCVNGFFLYLVMTYMGFKVIIYEAKNHIFLRDDKGRIADLYWQPLNIVDIDSEYETGVEISPLDLWHKYDLIRFMLSEISIQFIFQDKVII